MMHIYYNLFDSILALNGALIVNGAILVMAAAVADFAPKRTSSRKIKREGGGLSVELVPNPAEVSHAYRIGVHELCRSDSPRMVSIPESDRPVVQLPIGRDIVHAPTGAVLLQFRLVALEGRVGERVHDLEQPVFAWR